MASEELQEDLRCRFCLAEEVNELIPVFCIASTQNMLISHMALACTGIVISCRDKLPQYTCDGCLGDLDNAYTCWKRCRQSWGNYKCNSTLEPEVEDYRCRICLKDDVEELISIFCVADSQMMKISEIILRFSGLNVSDKDKFPQYICDVCLGELNSGFDFRKLARQSNVTSCRQLESSAIQGHVEEKPQNGTNDTSKTPLDNSLLNESLNINDPLEKTSPEVRKLTKSPAQKKSKEDIIQNNSKTTNGNIRTETDSADWKLQKKSLIRPTNSEGIVQKQETITQLSVTKKIIIDVPSPISETSESTKRIMPLIKTTYEKLPQVPLAISHKHEVSKATTKSNLISLKQTMTSTTADPLKIAQIKESSVKPTSCSDKSTAIQFPSNKQRNPKVASFSNPEEFKKLASLIMKKPEHKPSPVSFSNPKEFKRLASLIMKKPEHKNSPASVMTKICASLVPNDCIIVDEKLRFNRSWISAFRCGNCDNVCKTSVLQKTCIKCKLLFDNYFSIELERKVAKKGFVEAYCCKDCTFFTVTLKSLITHLTCHEKKFSCSGIVPRDDAEPKNVVKKGSVETVKPPAKLSEPPAESSESYAKSSEPVAKKQRMEEPETQPKAPVRKPPNEKWIRVEPAIRITPPGGGPALSAEIVVSDSDTNSEEPDAQAAVHEDLKFEYDPLDINDTLETEPQTDSYPKEAETTSNDILPTNSTFDVFVKLQDTSSNEELAGFEEEQLAAPRLVPLAGRTLNTELFDTLRDTDEYLMVFLKGFICCGCLKLFKSLEKLKRHHSRNHPKIPSSVNEPSCDICRTSCTNAEYHRVLASKRILYYCKFCQSLLLSEVDFKSHRNKSHTAEKPLPPSITVSMQYDVIVSKLNAQLELRKLESTAHSSNPFKATENEAIFQTLKETNDYKLLFLKGELCCGCQEWYSSKQALQAHCDERHAEQCEPGTTGQCELCQTNCRADSRLIRHRLQRARRLYYFCKICRAVLVHHADDYQAHRTVAHRQQLKPGTSDTTDTVEMLVSKVV